MTASELVVTPTTLEENEAIIARGVASVFEVGQALRRISTEHQFVDAGFESFETYVSHRWGMEKTAAYAQISAATVSAFAETHGLPRPPTLEATKPLAKVMNQAGGYDHSTKTLRNPEAGERAVVEAWREVVNRHDPGPDPENPRPITGRDVSKVINPPGANSGPPSWGEAIGRVGDTLIRAAKDMDKFDALIGERKPVAHVSEKAGRYATMAEELAARLRVVESKA
jgi:hypothetical protein